MDRYNLNLKKLKEKGLSSERIVTLTDVALDDNIDDDEYELLYNSNIQDKYLKELYELIKDIKNIESYEKEYNIIKIIEFIFLLDEDCLYKLFDCYARKYILDNIKILIKYYKLEYGYKGIAFIDLINESSHTYLDRDDYSVSYESNMYFDYIEKESIYSNIVKNYEIDIYNSYESKFSKLEELLYYLKLKLYKENKNYYTLNDDQIKFIIKLIYESDKYNTVTYMDTCMYLINKIFDNVSLDILSKYINTDKTIGELEECIRKDIMNYTDIDSLLPVDKMIKLLKSIPTSYLDDESFKYIFKMREIDIEKLKILLNFKSSSDRIKKFYYKIICIDSYPNFNSHNLVEKINNIDMDVFENFFDTKFLDSDIDVLDRLGSLIYNYKYDFGNVYYNFVFNTIKNLLLDKDNNTFHYIVIRFMKILVDIPYIFIDKEENVDINRIENFINILSYLFNSDTLHKQRVSDISIDNYVFDDYFYDRYKELVLLIISLYEFGISTDRIEDIYNGFNKDLNKCKIEKESWRRDIDVSGFNYDLNLFIESFDEVVYFHKYSKKEKEFIRNCVDIKSLKDSYNYFSKLPIPPHSFFGDNNKIELFIDILLCVLSNVDSRHINNEVNRLKKHISSKKDYDIYSLMKDEKFYSLLFKGKNSVE